MLNWRYVKTLRGFKDEESVKKNIFFLVFIASCCLGAAGGNWRLNARSNQSTAVTFR